MKSNRECAGPVATLQFYPSFGFHVPVKDARDPFLLKDSSRERAWNFTAESRNERIPRSLLRG
jgi:hypothetical protein